MHSALIPSFAASVKGAPITNTQQHPNVRHLPLQSNAGAAVFCAAASHKIVQ